MELTRRQFGRLTGAFLGTSALPLGMASMAHAQEAATLVVAVPSNPVGLEPANNKAEPVGSEIILNVFDTLVEWVPPTFDKVEGRVAESWTISDDGKTFAFKLRDGITFTDGTTLDAAAVKFSVERTIKLNPYVEASLGLIETIETPAPNEVVFTLKSAYPAFLAILAQPQSGIVSPTAVEQLGEGFADAPVGSGPFVIRNYTADTRVVLDANPDYFRGAPKLSRIMYRIIPEASTRRLELENGGIDMIQQASQLSAPATEEIAAFSQNPDIQILESASQIIRQLEFNNAATEGPYADPRVRLAIAHAIDYDGLLSGIFGGTAERVYGPLTSNSWAYNPKVEELAPTYDPEKAKTLLAEAGVSPEALNTTLYSFGGALWGAVATFVQANLADIGVKVTIEQPEFPAYRALQTAGQFNLALDGRQPWYNDPDAHITIGYLSSLADTAMTFRMPKDDALDALILAAQAEVDEAKRKALYFELQEKIVTRTPGAYLFSPKLIIFARANVKGLVVNSAPPLNEYWGVHKD
ncbi:MAG TPA: ABC transporter substrate-binding protein [Paracoccus sp. (in: a-proteobacteria)]|uniref:ABC transporter substrate-binding protein n=1 Tax=Paracoccus sp. TaxID=267 RepID=UPI002B7C4674|nr:ABC transporter substrate-binding protein [Paracoccus sp. (in: a-proteobacteria)]HWL58410.1 ABC transporter substrate-binding protein [Paracoccus sp. (in: a-proteobacteria)]